MVRTKEQLKERLGLLGDARKLVEQGWTQRAYYRNSKRFVDSSPDEAVEFCAIGALFCARGLDPHEELGCLRKTDMSSVMQYNDAEGRTQGDILDLYDQAIATTEWEINHGK